MKNYPLRLALLYFVASASWIVITDWISSNYSSASSIHLIQSIKGLLFITFSAMGLYFIARRYYNEISGKQREYLRLFEDNPHPMWVYDVKTLQFLVVNNAASQKYGYTLDEFLAKKITDIRPESERDLLVKFVKKSKDTDLNSGIWQHQGKDGKVFYAKVSSHITKFENKKARVVLAMDVDDQIKTQRELHLTENKLKGLINNTDDLIWLINKNGLIAAANEAFLAKIRQVLGITIDLCALTDINSFPENDFTRNWKSFFLRAIKGEQLKVEEEIKNGHQEFYEIILNPIYDDNNDIIGVGCFARDITSRKQSENRIKEQVARLKEIAWIQSHEVRRPTANILGLVELLKSSNTKAQNDQLMLLLDESTKELDGIIKRIVEKSSSV